MSRSPSESHFPVVPPGELKCVWMTAGFLSYQLCDREHDCDHCPLDRALHAHPRHLPAHGPEAESIPPTEAVPFAPVFPPHRLHRDRLYAREHCWVMWTEAVVGEEALVRVGLEPGLASALRGPRSVVCGELGADIERGDTHLWIMTDAGTLGVLAPLSGTLHQSNPLLLERPQLVSTRPMDEGWLYSLRVPARSMEFGTLMSVSAATRLYDVVAARFHETLAQALREIGAPWPALDSVDAMLQGIADALGPAQYFTLLHEAYR